MRSHKPIDGDAALFAREAERQFAALNRSLGAMRDRVQGLERAVRAPVPKGGARYTKRTRTSLSPFLSGGIAGLGSLFAGGLLGESGLGSYPSSAQVMSSFLNAFQRAQRIR